MPEIPEVLAIWLASLKGKDAEVMYVMSVSVVPPNYVTEAIKDLTQAEGNVGE